MRITLDACKGSALDGDALVLACEIGGKATELAIPADQINPCAAAILDRAEMLGQRAITRDIRSLGFGYAYDGTLVLILELAGGNSIPLRFGREHLRSMRKIAQSMELAYGASDTPS